MKITPDEDDRIWNDSDENGSFQFATPLRYVFFIVTIIILIILAWVLFFSGNKTNNSGDLPTIQADESPIKVKAEDTGVPSIKHQDKLVYNRISGGQTKPILEHILPEPDAPVALLQQGSLENFESPPPLKMVQQYPRSSDVKVSGQAHNAMKSRILEPTKLSNGSSSLQSISDLIDKEIFQQEKNTQPEVIRSFSLEKPSQTVMIQLGILQKNYGLAKAEWQQLQKDHRKLLGKYDPKIQKVDFGAKKGVYYRLQIGPFQSEEQARNIQNALREKKLGYTLVQ